MKNNCTHSCAHKRSFGLTLLFTLVVFSVLVCTLVLSWFALFGLYKLGVFNRFLSGVRPNMSFLFPIISLVVISFIIGAAISLVVSRVSLRPLRNIIAATNELANGNFNTRLNLYGIPEFKMLNESFNHMAQELGGIEILRSDFVNSFSHEFKTPIVSLCGFAKLLRNPELSESERAEYVDIIVNESERLATLATNVLSLSKIENQSIISEAENFNISEQVRMCVLLLEDKWMKKKINIDIDIPEIEYYGDSELLRQVWLNLLDNAIKFTPEKGDIYIDISKRTNRVTVKIRDNGCGIAPESISHVFDKFYQSDKSRSAQGNGIGLAIVQRIVRLHKGNVTVNSRPGTGSEFIVELPVMK